KMGALGFALLTPTYGAAGRRRGACARAAAGPADAHAARHPAATMRHAPADAFPVRCAHAGCRTGAGGRAQPRARARSRYPRRTGAAGRAPDQPDPRFTPAGALAAGIGRTPGAGPG